MTKPIKTLLIATLSCALFIVAAGIIKFNFLDSPYAGAPVTYISANGETVTAHFKTDNSVEISSHDFGTISLNSSPSASGANYSNHDGSFIFWSKGNEMMLLEKDIITYRGSKEIAPQSTLTGSIWKYTGTMINGELQPAVKGTLIILNFDNNRLFGEASCNSFFGHYQYNQENPNQITFSELGSSMALCEDKVTAQEDLFLAALADTTSITFNENSLILHYGTDKSLQFKLFGAHQ